MNSGFGKSLLVACVLYFCSTYGDATSLARVSSIAAAAVEQNLPAGVYNRAFNRQQQARRYKREVITKSLKDPENCIRQCDNNETQMIVSATMKNMAKLVAIALQNVDITGDEFKTPEKEAAFKKQVEDTTIANMGPLFKDLCSASKKTDDCYSKCPDSELRKISQIWHDKTETLCEPSKNWNNFSDYWTALNCTNTTDLEKPCEHKCGQEDLVGNVTHLEMEEVDDDDDDDNNNKDNDVKFKYEADAKTNAKAVAPVCKTYSCEIDCYKPIMTDRCGAKAYELYARMTQSEPRTSLRVLKEFNAIDSIKECKQFQ